MQIFVYAYAEDAVNKAIMQRLLGEFKGKYCLKNPVKITGGAGQMDKGLAGWNQALETFAANNIPVVYFGLRDMDTLAYPEDKDNCPESAIKRLLKNSRKHDNLLLRIAVAEGENWLLADYERLCGFLSVAPKRKGDMEPDSIKNGKEAVIDIARASRKYKAKIAPLPGERMGAEYNQVMTEFIRHHWQPREAARRSKSLRRTLARLEQFTL